MRIKNFLARRSLFTHALAQQNTYPIKTIRLIVPFTPGGVTDTSGRLIAEQLSKRLGQQVAPAAPGGLSYGTSGTPDKFSDDIKRDLARYGQVVKAAGIKAE